MGKGRGGVRPTCHNWEFLYSDVGVKFLSNAEFPFNSNMIPM